MTIRVTISNEHPVSGAIVVTQTFADGKSGPGLPGATVLEGGQRQDFYVHTNLQLHVSEKAN